MKSPGLIIAACRRSGRCSQMEGSSSGASFFQLGNFLGDESKGSSRWRDVRHFVGDRRSLDRETLDADFAAPVDGHERRDGRRVQPLSDKTLNDFQSFFRRVRMLVGTIGGQCIKGVGYRNDSRQQWDLLPLKAVRVSPTVESFVMKLNARKHLCQLGYRPGDVGA